MKPVGASVWLVVLGVGALLAAGEAAAQNAGASRWEIQPVQSAVWWQVNPHFGHLWATTCPNDDTWQAGEGRSTQYRGKASVERRVRQTNVKESDETIPLFPRDTVRANCRRAISGTVAIGNASTLAGAAGMVTVRADSLVIGSDMRDAFARRYIYKSALYPTITFTIDSLKVTERGDTIRGMAYGIFQLRDGRTPIVVPIRIWDDPAGRRVQGKWHITGPQLIEDYHVPRGYLAMGVASKLWDELHMGFDLILRQAGGSDDRAGGR